MSRRKSRKSPHVATTKLNYCLTTSFWSSLKYWTMKIAIYAINLSPSIIAIVVEIQHVQHHQLLHSSTWFTNWKSFSISFTNLTSANGFTNNKIRESTIWTTWDKPLWIYVSTRAIEFPMNSHLSESEI